MAENNYITCYACGLCFPAQITCKKISTKDLVIWIERGELVSWKPRRTPALGWNTLTLLEALSDSAKTFLNLKNYDDCEKQINKILKILRNKIKFAKKEFVPLIKRCEYRETKKTRCNKTPIEGIKEGMALCSYHFRLINESKINLNNFI